MRCKDFDWRMQGLLDSRLPPEHDHQLIAHSAVCLHCERVLEVQRQLLATTALSSTVETSPRLTAGVLSAVARQSSARRRTRRGLLACALAASLTWLLLVPDEPRENKRVARTASETHQVLPSKSHTRGTPQQNAPEVIEPGHRENRTLSTRDAQLVLNRLKTPLAQWNMRSSLQMRQIADGLRPIATSFSIALDALRRTLPGGKRRALSKPQAGRVHVPRSGLT